MGTRSWGADDYASYATTSATYAKATSVHDVFTSRVLDSYLDPSKFLVRESRNSAANPESTPIIFGLDVTGSMGSIAWDIAKEGLGTLITETFKRKPVSDPHIMFMGIGDVDTDRSPLQVSQFETDITMLEQLTKIHVEGGGGANWHETYNGPWHFAQFHTSCDAFEKDDRKGFLFTFGDERAPSDLSESQLKKIYGRGQEVVATNAQLLEMLSSKYNVFHLMIEQGSHMRGDAKGVIDSWTSLLGQRAIPVSDYKKLAEVIISVMQITNGIDKDDVVKSWSGGTAVAVSHATRGLTAAKSGASTGLVRF